MNFEVDWTALVTAIAAILGPLIAVWITRRSDERKEFYARRMEIFRTLMRTRKLAVHIDHVSALNLVEIEFSDQKSVISAWKDYLRNLGEAFPSTASELQQSEFLKRRESLLTKLISEIAKVIKVKIEQMDIFEGNYVPQGWHDDDWEQRLMRRALTDVMMGRRALLVQGYSPAIGSGPYPPAPNQKSNLD